MQMKLTRRRVVEAALFTGLFWLLLVLWQSLFHMLEIGRAHV